MSEDLEHPAATEPDLSGFGFDSPDEWMGRLRRVQGPPPLGRFGGYELLEIAGHGGQGVVYKARQVQTGRTVALKRLLTGPFASSAMRERFRREVEVDLALKHPYIVVVHDVQAIDEQPVVVMEWIKGVPVDRWTGERDRQAPSDVLTLFLKICEGVHHAHQRGVIHRDLKPSNILVDEAGDPHVLDFGLAGLVDADPSGRPSLTRSHGFVGTLAYAPPEQIRGEADAVDVRADVYALGCILYESLTGRPPFQSTHDLAALSHAVCHDDPARPSSVSQSADADLDAIIARAMARDKNGRYPSVEALASDVRRHLNHEPVEARSPGSWYRLRKLARRHRALVGGTCVLVAVLGVATVVSTALWRGQSRQRAEAEQIAAFLESMLSGTAPEIALGRDTTMLREVLDDAAGRILAGELRRAPRAEVRLRRTVGDIYTRLSAFDEAGRMLDPAVAMSRSAFGSTHTEVAATLGAVGLLLYQRSEDEGALASFRESLAIRERLGPGDDPAKAEDINNLALCLGALGEHDDALAEQERALAMFRRLYPGDHRDIAAGLNNLGASFAALGRDAESLEKFEAALAMFRRLHPGDHPDSAQALHNVGFALGKLGRPGDAMPLLKEALAIRRRRTRAITPMSPTASAKWPSVSTGFADATRH